MTFSRWIRGYSAEPTLHPVRGLRKAALMVVGAAIAGLTGYRVQGQLTSASVPDSKQSGAAPQYTIHTQVPLTILDVVVTDSKGKPVHGLKQSDFTVLEDKKVMTPKTFEEHRSDQTPPSAVVQPKLNLGPNTFTNFIPTPQKAGPLNILLEDDLNTPFTGQGYIRDQLIDFLKKSSPGARMAIFRLSSQLSILQGFTTDTELLKTAIAGKNNLPQESHLFATGMEAEAHIEWSGTSLTEAGSSSGGSGDATSRFAASALKIAHGGGGTADDASSSMSGTLSPAQRARLFTDTTRGRVQLTLAAMTQIARYLSGMPGRKNLVWFSGSFPANTRANLSYGEDYSDSIKSMGEVLARSQIAVYSIDGRGLNGNPYPSNFTCSLPEILSSCSSTVPAPFLDSKTRTIDEHKTMDMVSEETGGKAFYNTNDLVGAVEEALDDGSNYYTITYTPTNRKQDGSYRKIRVDLDYRGLHLAYRPGYYADDSSRAAPSRKVAQDSVRPAVRVSAMQTAMVRGSLAPGQILFKVKVVPSVGTEDTLPPGNKPNAELMKPPYRRYTIYYLAGISNIAFATNPDGSRRGDIEFAVVVYDADGQAINTQTSPLNANIRATDFQAMLKSGMQVNQTIDVPAKGEYFLRIGVHDFASDHVGAVEIPLSSIQPRVVPVAVPGK